MRLITTFNRIMSDFPQYAFVSGQDFKWSPDDATIFYPEITTRQDLWSLLHEVSHGELGHTTYGLDVELVSHETQAWEHALLLASTYDTVIDDDYIQEHLDTYRTWLHDRSKCPACSQNGLQTKNTYSCINCRCIWRANEARVCALRRVRLPSQSQTS